MFVIIDQDTVINERSTLTEINDGIDSLLEEEGRRIGYRMERGLSANHYDEDLRDKIKTAIALRNLAEHGTYGSELLHHVTVEWAD